MQPISKFPTPLFMCTLMKKTGQLCNGGCLNFYILFWGSPCKQSKYAVGKAVDEMNL